MASHWTYEGESGCYHWGDLGYSIADTGKHQSPIDIETHECKPIAKGGSKLKIQRWAPCKCTIANIGFTIRVSPTERKHHIEVDDEKYCLIQFHFHSPAEHTVNHERAKLELHLVHESLTNPGKLAVIGIMFVVGKESQFLSQIFNSIPMEKHVEVHSHSLVSLLDLNLNTKYWRYDGSLTTPPCTEGVSWMLIQAKHEMSAKQFDAYLTAFPMETNRPVQFRNERVVQNVSV